MTWKELKEFCNSLPENVLDKDVIVWREEDVISPINAEQLKEDHYIGEDDYDNEGCYTLSEAGLTLEDVEERGLKKVYSKGDPILWEDF